LVALASASYPCYCAGVYTSTNAGATWKSNAAPFSISPYGSAVASSADGTKLVASADRIYTSTDSGLTWWQSGALIQPWSVASSADGSNLVAVGESSSFLCCSWSIYTSTNGGLTWTPTSVPNVNYN